jgi:predicted metalloprotease
MANWNKIKTRGNVQDRRGVAGSVGGVGIVGIGVILAVMYFGGVEEGVQVMETLQEAQQLNGSATSAKQSAEFAGEDEYEIFASQVLGTGNLLWSKVFKSKGLKYREPTLVLFRGMTQSACGGASSAVGPHYCPVDETIYLDETFFDEMTKRFGARGGDVAEAYVIAHEVGHHVQKVFGIMEQVRAMQSRFPGEINKLSVKQELQADCFAGIWAYSLRDRGIFEKDEIIEAMDAAESVGDDRIQKKTTGRVNPESWTHGSSVARKKWFSIGYDNGDYDKCDTFVE